MPALLKKKTASFNLKNLLENDKDLERFIRLLYNEILDKLSNLYNTNQYYLDEEITSSIKPITEKFGIRKAYLNFERILFWDVLKPLQEEDYFKWGLKPEYNKLNPSSKNQIIKYILRKYVKDWPFFKSNLKKEIGDNHK